MQAKVVERDARTAVKHRAARVTVVTVVAIETIPILEQSSKALLIHDDMILYDIRKRDFHEWGYPNSWMVFVRENPSING